jgi:hypothetical protein
VVNVHGAHLPRPFSAQASTQRGESAPPLSATARTAAGTKNVRASGGRSFVWLGRTAHETAKRLTRRGVWRSLLQLSALVSVKRP